MWLHPADGAPGTSTSWLSPLLQTLAPGQLGAHEGCFPMSLLGVPGFNHKPVGILARGGTEWQGTIGTLMDLARLGEMLRVFAGGGGMKICQSGCLKRAWNLLNISR